MDEAEISSALRDAFAKINFKYNVPEGAERDALILQVLKKIASDTQVIGAPERTDVWEKGWGENLQEFIASGHDAAKLTPKFLRPNMPIRFNQQYIIPEDSTFELDLYVLLRRALFEKYLGPFATVYEFGCGTSFNLKALAELYPEKELHALDFVPSAAKLADEVGKAFQLNIQGHVFNMRKPDMNLKLKPGSAIFHIGTTEQLASDIGPFFEYLLAQKPALCMALEPTVELYDENNLVDYLAATFHRKRGYTEGYLPRLKQLEAEKKIEILKVHRTYFGSFFLEGYSLMVWRPVV